MQLPETSSLQRSPGVQGDLLQMERQRNMHLSQSLYSDWMRESAAAQLQASVRVLGHEECCLQDLHSAPGLQ